MNSLYKYRLSKGILNNGSESTIIESARLGWLMSDTGRKTTISSVLDSSKRHNVWKVFSYFERHGLCEILVVNKQIKSANEANTMKFLRKILKFELDTGPK